MNGEDYGIVFSGGGALGAWEVGCYRAIRSRHGDRSPQVVTGASAGAINAVGVCAGMTPPQLTDTWSKITDAKVYRTKFGPWMFCKLVGRAAITFSATKSTKRFLEGQRSLYDTSPLKQTLTEILRDYYQQFCQSPTRCALSVTNLTQGRKELLYKLPPGETLPQAAHIGRLAGSWQKILSQDMLVQALMGSTALPVLFPPFEGYFDGGVLLNQPITPAIALGALNLYVVVPSSEALGTTDHLLAIASTLVTTWLSASLIAQIDNVRLRNMIRAQTQDPKIRLCLIRPPQDITARLGVTLLSFGKSVQEMVAYGEQVARDRLDRFDPADEKTWY
jgi:predicted acylesterase/phospholipase RssA